MCGIVGCLDLAKRGRVERPVLAAMCDRLLHRGPDASGLWVEPDVGLGSRRLKIIDLSAAGDQPLFNEDGTLVLVCNGEIFNFRELRAELAAKGHRFRSQTDVEVLPHLFEEHGAGLLERLNGQFALALYDQRRGELLLARDPFGINPLFYTVADGLLLFASEIKALLCHPAVARRVDLTGLDQVLCWPGLVSPRTLFQGISSLSPGHALEVRGGEVTLRQYWDLDYPLDGEPGAAERSEDEWVEELRAILAASVERRLVSDVPVGIFLSGGIDSSLLAGLVRQVAPQAVRHSFSVTFADQEIDEGRYQRLVARELGSEHCEILVDDETILRHLREMVCRCECPVKETFNTCALALAEAARQAGAIVVLAGQGADELFAGYPGYRFDLAGGSSFQRRDGAGLGAPPTVEEVEEEELRARLWGDGALFYERDQVPFREVRAALYAPAVAAELGRFDCLEQPLVDHRRLAGRHRLHQRSYLDVKLRLADHLLSDHGDRMVMARSVEGRYPFLDPAVAEFARRLPPQLKVKDLTEKYIVRRAAEGLVPPAILAREKFGFRAPASPMLLRRNLPWVEELLAPERIRRQGYFNADTVEHLRRQYSRRDFQLHPHLEVDLLMVVLTFNLMTDFYQLPDLGA